MRYEGKIYRPPSEAWSLIIQATVGCSYNRCTFCAMYRDTRFKIRSLDDIREDIASARAYYGNDVSKVFLADGDALIMKTAQLEKIVKCCREHFPALRRVSAYATPQSLLLKSGDELGKLRDLGLSTLYLGVESGSEAVLERLKKGVTQAEMIEAGQKAVQAGMKLSTMIILGAGGSELSREHARESARVLNAIGPRFISTLTMMVVPGTPLEAEQETGRFTPPTPRQCVEEIRELIAGLEVEGAVFRSNHVSNMVSPAGTLQKDKARMVDELDTVLADAIPEEFGPRGY